MAEPICLMNLTAVTWKRGNLMAAINEYFLHNGSHNAAEHAWQNVRKLNIWQMW